MVSELVDRFIRHIRATRPSIVIGPGPTYTRWFVIPRNPVFNVYLHYFINDDEEHLHDHRMLNVSVLLQGGYFEERFYHTPRVGKLLPALKRRRFVSERSFIVRLPWTPHRVVLSKDVQGHPKPIWSLFIGFPHIRNWGFWIRDHRGNAMWVPHQEYVVDADPLSPGYGQSKA